MHEMRRDTNNVAGAPSNTGKDTDSSKEKAAYHPSLSALVLVNLVEAQSRVRKYVHRQVYAPNTFTSLRFRGYWFGPKFNAGYSR